MGPLLFEGGMQEQAWPAFAQPLEGRATQAFSGAELSDCG